MHAGFCRGLHRGALGRKLLVAGAVGAASLIAATSQAALVITEVMSQSGSDGTPDWFEIANTDASPVDVSGYKMDDNSFAFANAVALQGVTTIPAGARAVFIESTSGTPADEVAAFRGFWGGAAASGLVGYYVGSQTGVSLSSGGDGIVLFKADGSEVTRVTFGAATSGSSFDNVGGFGHVSQLGVGGAYASVSTSPANIGSPTVVAPEPATLAGLMIGGVLARRRR